MCEYCFRFGSKANCRAEIVKFNLHDIFAITIKNDGEGGTFIMLSHADARKTLLCTVNENGVVLLLCGN